MPNDHGRKRQYSADSRNSTPAKKPKSPGSHKSSPKTHGKKMDGKPGKKTPSSGRGAALATGDKKKAGGSFPKKARKGDKKFDKKFAKGDKSKGKRYVKKDKKAEDGSKPKLHELTRKDRKLERRKHKPESDIRRSAIALWEKLRRHDLAADVRRNLLSQLMSVLEGNILKLMVKHDTARVVQACLRWGREKERNRIFKELNGHFLELVQSKYARFAIKRIFKYGNAEQRAIVFNSFYGHVQKLIKHKEAADVLETAYVLHADSKQRKALVREFYGPHYALTKESQVPPLKEVVENDEHKKELILKYLQETLSPLTEKQVIQHSLIHHALLDFFVYARGAQRAEMIEAIRESLVHILHTRDGAMVTMHCLWHGTAKDRKVIVKTFKTFVKKICMEEHGHLVLLAVFDTVDDTKLVEKALLKELIDELGDIADDNYGRKVLHYLLEPRSRHHCHPHRLQLLKAGDCNEHSKKSLEDRSRELLSAMSPSLLKYCRENAADMMRNKSRSQLLFSTASHAIGDSRPLFDAVAECATAEFCEAHIACDESGHFLLKRLIIQDKTRQGDGPFFSVVLINKLPAGMLIAWARTNRGAFVVASLLECGVEETVHYAHEQLKPHKKELKSLSSPGAAILCKHLFR